MRISQGAGLLAVLILTGCGGTSSGSGAATSAAAVAGQSSSSSDTGGPTDAYIQTQFTQQITTIAADAAKYRQDVAAANDALAITDAGTLYSEIASLPLILSNARLFGAAAQQTLPAVKAAATNYATALNDVNGGTAGHIGPAEMKVKSAATVFWAALQSFASNFGGTVPRQ